MPRKQLVAAKTKAAVPNFEPDFFSAMGLRVRDDPFDRPYTQHPWVYLVNQVIATAISQVPFRVYREARSTERRSADERAALMKAVIPRANIDDLWLIAQNPDPRRRMRAVRTLAPWLRPRALMRAVMDVEAVESGPWYDLFMRVNPLMTRAQLWEATLVNYNTAGECFWVLEGAGSELRPNEIPTEIWPVGPGGWKPKIDRRTKLPTLWEWTRNEAGGGTVVDKFDPEQLVWWRRYNPYGLRGVSAIEGLKREIEQDYLASIFNLAFFKNGATIGGWITAERRMTPDQRKTLLEMLEARNVGAKKAHRPNVFEGGVKFEESKQNHRAMAFYEMRQWVRDTVLSVHRVPKAMAGLGSYDTRATAVAETRNFWEVTLLPQVQYGEDLMESDLFTTERMGEGVVWGAFDLSVVQALREDLAQTTDVAQRLQSMGWTAEEVNERLEMGMPVDNDWLRTWWRSPGLVDARKKDEEPEDEPGAQPGATEEEEEEEGARPGHRRITLPGTSKKSDEEQRELLWQSVVSRVFDPGEDRFERKFRGFLVDLRAHQLRLIDQRGEVSDPELFLFNEQEWSEKYVERMEKQYDLTWEAATEEVLEEIEAAGGEGDGGDEPEVEGARAADKAQEDMVRLIARRGSRTVRTIRRQLHKHVSDRVRDGGTSEDIKAAVREYFSLALARGKARTVARTETSITVNAARRYHMERRGVVEHEWITAGDERVRHNHVIYGEAGPHPIGFNWATLAGHRYRLEYPCMSGAPGHEVINCRCISIVVSV